MSNISSYSKTSNNSRSYSSSFVHIIFVSFLIISFSLTITTGQSVDLPDQEYQLLLNLRTLFKLESFFPENSTGYVEFCSEQSNNENTTIVCLTGNVYTLRLTGDGNTQVMSDFFNFTKINELNITKVDTSQDPNFTYNLPGKLAKLVCNHCNIKSLNSNSSYTWKSISNLYLTNNPIEGEWNLNGLSDQMSSFDYSTSDPSMIREFHMNPLSDKINGPMVIKGYLSSIPNFTNYSKALTLNLTLGLNFRVSSISNISSGYLIDLTMIDVLNQHTPIEFPWDTLNNRDTSKNIIFTKIYLNNINLIAPNYYSISNLPFITMNIINSPNFNVNGNLPFTNFNPNLLIMAFNNIGLTKPLSSNIPFGNLTYFDLSRNNITGSPPTYPIVSNMNYAFNQLTGTIPKEYCNSFVTINNNLLTGVLPSCFTCSLYDQSVRNSISNNQFSNYRDNYVPSQYPECTTLKIYPATLIESAYLHVFGEDIGFKNAFFTKFPNVTFPIKIVNRKLEYLDSRTYPIFKHLAQDGYVNITFPSANNKTVSAPIVLGGVNVSAVLHVFPYLNVGISLLIQGNGFGNNISRVAIQFGPYECVVKQVLVSAAMCTIFSLNIPDDTYVIRVSSLSLIDTVVTTNYTYVYKRNFTFPYVGPVTSCASTGGKVLIIGLFGIGASIPSTTVVIGDLPCYVTFVNETQLECDLRDKGTFGAKDVIVTVSGSSFNSSKAFVYTDDPSSVSCSDPNCSGNGICNFGGCLCYEGWVGPICNIPQSGPVVVVPRNNLTTIIKDNIKFDFSVYSIIELDGNREVVREVILKDFIASGGNNKTHWTFSTAIETATISYTITNYDKPTNVSFAGLQFRMEANSIKLSARIQYWRFLGRLNSLQFVIKTSAQIDEGCAKTSINSQVGNSLNYLTIEKEGKILYSRFIDRVLADGRPTFTATEILKTTENSVYVAINIPFGAVVELDPDFSLLVNPNPEDLCAGDSLNWVIPVAVVVPITTITLIIILVLFVKTKFYIKFTKRGIIIVKKVSERDDDPSTIEVDRLG